MRDDNCIFCKLANGDIPTNTIYEDADFRVILDASPATKGHALILPKQHYANMFEMDDEVLAKAAKLAKKVITHEKEVLGCDGYNVLQNNKQHVTVTSQHFFFVCNNFLCKLCSLCEYFIIHLKHICIVLFRQNQRMSLCCRTCIQNHTEIRIFIDRIGRNISVCQFTKNTIVISHFFAS